jgi:hypothetical protein
MMMTNSTPNPTEAERDAVSYLEAGRMLTMTKAGLEENHAFRVFVLWALSVIHPCVGGTDADLAAWLRAEADAIDLNGARPGGSA